MDNSLKVGKLESLIAENPKLIFTMVSYGLILTMFVNLNIIRSSFLGLSASVFYFLINGVFLGHTFFQNESTFLRLVLGMLLFIIILGFFGWLAVIIYNLSLLQFALVLFIASTLSSLLNRKVKNRNATQNTRVNKASTHY